MSAISTVTVIMVSQNMGAQKYDRARDTVKYSIKMATIVTIICSIFVFMTSELWVSMFNRDAMVIESGSMMIRMMVFSNIFIGWSHVYHGAIRGSGNVKIPMINAVFSQCIIRFLFVYFGLMVVYDVRILYLSGAVGYTCAGVIATLYFKFSKWTKNVQLR